MHLRDLAGKSVLILGFGKEGQATLNMLRKHAPDARITLADRNENLVKKQGLAGCEFQLGPDYMEDLDRFDVIIKSPGIPPCTELDAVKTKIRTPTQLFFGSIAQSGAVVVGITGSKGKSTTSSMIFEILKRGKKDASLIGNIGEPAIAHIDEAIPGKIFVMEMSSYQLMDLTLSPHIAVVTSFFPDHLDYHGSLDAYKDAKTNIARHQQKDDVIFYNAHSVGTRDIALQSPGTRIPFSPDECPVPIDQTQLIGDHNRSNIAGAYKVGIHLGVTHDDAIAAIKNFKGLPHRLQSLGIHRGIEWIDDAISTTPESTVAAIDALGDRIVTIILGGQDRGYDISGLATRIKNSKIENVILIGQTGPRIHTALEAAKADVTMTNAESMEEVVTIAKRVTKNPSTALRAGTEPGTRNIPVCVLSTASPSYDMFRNFEEKGDEFKKYILR